jgi:hypothetical protein
MHSANFYMNTVKNRNASPSKRWQTTMQSALDDVATQLQGNYDRSAMVKDLADRKISNTKTSISFGNEKVCSVFLFSVPFVIFCVIVVLIVSSLVVFFAPLCFVLFSPFLVTSLSHLFSSVPSR